MRVFKCKITDVTDGDYQKKINAIGRPNEEINNRSYFQHVGFTSIPPAGSVGILIAEGDNLTVIASADPIASRPTLSNQKDVAMYADADKYIKILANGDIEASNNNNKIVLKANGDIELGSADLANLVKDAVLSTLQSHTHPVSGAVAIASTDAGMIVLSTAPGNKTSKVKGQ